MKEQNSELKFGHHPGLFALFFAEMWERFSYYGMRALLIYYMTKSFLSYSDERAARVYGAYTSLVYMTPFIGGLVADKLIGQRAAVVLGGLMMALGHLIMSFPNPFAFYVALALLVCGNGLFKPNIGTILGKIYSNQVLAGKRDAAFTIFYMGVNLGAAIAPLVCVYAGEAYGWHYGFGLAAIGMVLGLAIFVVQAKYARFMVLVGGLIGAVLLSWIGFEKGFLVLPMAVLVAVALLVATAVSFSALRVGGVPPNVGAPPKPEEYKRNIFLVVIVSFFLVFVFAWLCDHPEIAGQALIVAGILALTHIGINSIKLSALERSRIGAILILAFFSMLFWAFFEQAGSSLSLFTDRNVDRVNEDRKITPEDVGKEISIVLTQEQVGYKIDGSLLTIDRLDALRQDAQANQGVVRRRILIEPEHVGMGIGGKEIPAGMFQAVNPIFILIFGLLFTSLWVWLARRNREPTTPTKFVLGLVQIGLGFGVLYFGSLFADERGMVGMGWLVLAYLLHTTGELCLSPVGLSMVTRLAPSGMVATMMGAWYLATAFSQYLAGLIAALAGAQKEGEGGESIPLPKDTLPIYADVFGKVAIAAVVAGALLFVMSPLVVRWMGEQTRNEKKVGVG